jgi:hypothetical protein
MKESCCTSPITCDRCREDCWPEWTVTFPVLRLGEVVEIAICDSCISELAETICQPRERSDP